MSYGRSHDGTYEVFGERTVIDWKAQDEPDDADKETEPG